MPNLHLTKITKYSTVPKNSETLEILFTTKALLKEIHHFPIKLQAYRYGNHTEL